MRGAAKENNRQRGQNASRRRISDLFDMHLSPEENERIASYIIDKYNFELCDIPALDGLSNGVPGWSDGNPALEKAKRIFPHREKGEGHFTALFRSPGDTEAKRFSAAGGRSADLTMYREFEKAALNINAAGRFEFFGENLYIVPEGIDLNGIKTVRAGLHLGTMKKNRFEPSHAAAAAFPAEYFKNIVNLNEADAYKYLRGETLPCDEHGWTAAVYKGFVLGWGKANGGMLKNRYPKGLLLLR